LSLLSAPAPIELSTRSLPDALPILPFHQRARRVLAGRVQQRDDAAAIAQHLAIGQIAAVRRPQAMAARELVEELQVVDCLARREDRKSTRLNSSHVKISYAVFCLKK